MLPGHEKGLASLKPCEELVSDSKLGKYAQDTYSSGSRCHEGENGSCVLHDSGFLFAGGCVFRITEMETVVVCVCVVASSSECVLCVCSVSWPALGL